PPQERILGSNTEVAPATDAPIPASLLPGRTPLDELFVDGITCPASASDFHRTYSAVSSVLVHGFDAKQQQRLIEENRAEWRHFFESLVRAYLARKRGEKSFDRWLKVSLEHGLCRLLPGWTRLPHDKRAEARCRARAYFRQTMWAAYQAMSRGFGASMLLVWLAFTRSPLISPTDIESRLFRQVNAPQLYLAGLPLAFFPPAQ